MVQYFYRSMLVLLVAGLLQLGGGHAIIAPAFAKGAVEVASTSGRGVVDEIVGLMGLKPNFELREANVENAAAVIHNGRRYILYNSQFMRSVNTASKTNWAAVSILAHEIGHHLNGHTLSSSGSNHADELEADEFSGFVLRKMGASLAEAQAAMQTISSERDSYTHPGKSKRLRAIAMGWNNADQQLLASANNLRSNKVERETPAYKQPAQVQQRSQVHSTSQPVLASQHILKEVFFNSAPHDKFYLTTKYSLVRVNQNGVQIVGKVKRTNTDSFPYIIVDEHNQPQLFISYQGLMINTQGRRVGFLKEPSEV